LDFAPTKIKALDRLNIIQAAAGDAHAAVLTMEGDVYTWGIYKNKHGINVGFNPDAPKNEFQEEPEMLSFSDCVVQIGCTSNKTIALTQAGDVFEWGEISLNKRSRHSKDGLQPTTVNMPEKVVAIFCSTGENVYALSSEGTVYSWGKDKYFQLGIYNQVDEDEKERKRLIKKEEDDKKKEEEEKNRKDDEEDPDKKKPKFPAPKPKKRKDTFQRPHEATGLNTLKLKIKKICGGEGHTVILTQDDNVYAWGSNKYGQLGLDTDELVIKEATKLDLNNVVDIACGAFHTLFVTSDGKVHACGLAKDGRFPSRNDQEKGIVVICNGIDKQEVVGVSCGKRHNLIVTKREK